MKSNFVKKIILLKQMLDDMEKDLGLASLSAVEKNVYLAAQDTKSSDGLVRTKDILEHKFTQDMSRPTFFRALKSIEAMGLLSHSDRKKVGLFFVSNGKD